MANSKDNKMDIFSKDDPLDINELASLNNDISAEFIEQLQSQIAQNASEFTEKDSDSENDTQLFEEVTNSEDVSMKTNIPQSAFDDSFEKKYKAKLNSQPSVDTTTTENMEESNTNEEPTVEQRQTDKQPLKKDKDKGEESSSKKTSKTKKTEDKEQIEDLTSGNIIERPVDKEQLEYNESLNYLDENVKYSKYVIYINPENKEFIDSLTVKERKNLINRILREQDDIAITKRRLGIIQTIVKHSIVVIITIALSVPIIYMAFNASIEASINNYRKSQTLFKTLYKDNGKIKTQAH